MTCPKMQQEKTALGSVCIAILLCTSRCKKFCLLNVHVDEAAHATFIAELRARVCHMSAWVEAALLTYEECRSVHQSLKRVAGGPGIYQPDLYGHRGGRGGCRYHGGFHRSGVRGCRQATFYLACCCVHHRCRDCESCFTRSGHISIAAGAMQQCITKPFQCMNSRHCRYLA
jgi:hypothetical protein